MRYTQHRWLIAAAIAIATGAGANSALADPFAVRVADVQGLSNSTSATNASTIDAINVAPDGIHLDVTWRVGQNTDPFGPGFGLQDFPRIGVSRFTNSEAGGTGRDLTVYDGIEWTLMSDRDVFVQPFIQTAPDWTFYEPTPGGYNLPGDMSSNVITLDFNDARNFSGLLPANIVHPDANSEIRANAFGLQIVGPGGLVVGDEVPGHIWIAGSFIPEPSAVVLLGLASLALVGFGRRPLR
jgi:hypothetical protein